MTNVKPWYEGEGVTLYAGDCLRVLREIPDGSMDAVITDPPYSSGGMTKRERSQSPTAKYVMDGTQRAHPCFTGDNRDQRGFLAWAQLWLSECCRIVRPGGVLLCFTDWRQLPLMTDAIQAGGWVWKGIVPWDKTEGTKPQRGWFRAQCEYVLTAVNGTMGREQDRENAACLPGIYRQNVMAAQKQHITGKPLPLMCELMRVLLPGSTVLDPFCGSGTTLLAAREMGMRSVGVEMSAEYLEVTKARLEGSRGDAETQRI